MIRKEEVVATLWHDEAVGIFIASTMFILLGTFLDDFLWLGWFGVGMGLLTGILMYVEKIRKRSDAEKFKFMTYWNRVFKRGHV